MTTREQRAIELLDSLVRWCEDPIIADGMPEDGVPDFWEVVSEAKQLCREAAYRITAARNCQEAEREGTH